MITKKAPVEKENEINVLVYSKGRRIFFSSSAIIHRGLLSIHRINGCLIVKQNLVFSNYEQVLIPYNVDEVYVIVISDEICFEKKMQLF